MKKTLSYIFLSIIILLVTIVSVPFNNLNQWGINLPVFLSDYELYLKGGIAVVTIIFAIIFLIVANKQQKADGDVKLSTRNMAVLPAYVYSLATMSSTVFISYHLYKWFENTQTQLIVLLGAAAIVLVIFFMGYFLISEFKKTNNTGRVFRTITNILLVIATSGIAYFNLNYRVSTYYPQIPTKFTLLFVPLFFILYLAYVIMSNRYNKQQAEEASLENDVVQAKKDKNIQYDEKSIIVPKQEKITSHREDLDPTKIIYADVPVDPEFSRMISNSNQATSIEYYIEKPKLFKPLDPTFDELVDYVRELPQVVTKLDEERITFYVERVPFLVLMNYGNYYRMAFKYDLEQGIRLIIKYPTISKNKATKDELWFKANNYGDIPKEVIYQIVKNSHSNYIN